MDGNNHSSNVVEKLFDCLRAYNGSGKHMARHCLELALCANNAGYAGNPLQTIWGWRNWVVRAFDGNMLIIAATSLQHP